MIIAGIDCSMNGTGIYKFELDDKFNLISKDYLAFTTKKKYSNNNILYYNPKKDFKSYIEKNNWMYEKIFTFINGCECVAIEDYAFGAKGRVFDIAEFTGVLKSKICDREIPIRLYSIGTIKMYATTKGDAKKPKIEDMFLLEPNIPNLTHMPSAHDKTSQNPRCDIHDAYFITKLLQLELSIRAGHTLLNQLPQEKIKIFNRVTTANPVNILARDFLTN